MIMLSTFASSSNTGQISRYFTPSCTNGKGMAFKTFLYALIAASVAFLPFIIAGQGMFTFLGDFNAQQIPFYVHTNELVHTGNIAGWDWATELGGNIIGSYTYYTLCSPFFWLTVPFPATAVPYLMGPLLILKIALSALTAYIFFRRYTKTSATASFASILYAFSGWSVFNIFFNQFHESLIVFPLVLWALDKLIIDRKKGIFAVCIALAAITNYFMFFGMFVYLVIYWIIRSATKSWRMDFRCFFRILLEGIIGVGLSMFVLMPTALAVLSMGRINSYLMGWDMLRYNNYQLYLYIVQSLFFPAELGGVPAFFENTGAKWSSVSLYLPFIGPILCFAWLKNKKGWLKILIIVSAIFALIPILNSLFTMCNFAYYARWFYMPVLFMALASAKTIEEIEPEKYKKPMLISLIAVIFIFLLCLFCPNADSNGNLQFGIYNRTDPIMMFLMIFTFLLALLSLIVFYDMFIKKNSKKPSTNKIIAITLIFSIVTMMFNFAIGNMVSGRKSVDYIQEYLQETSDFKPSAEMDDDNSRVEFICSNTNNSVYMNRPTVSFFHSIVPASTSDFYETFGRKRTVYAPNMMCDAAYGAITSVKYLYVNKDFVDNFDELCLSENERATNWKDNYEKYGYALKPGYEEIGTIGESTVFKNKYYVPYGTKYNYYITKTDYENIPDSEWKTNILLKALIIPDNEKNTYRYTLRNISESIDLSDPTLYTEEAYINDCKEKASSAATDFTVSNNTISCNMSTNSDGYIYLSVPYEKGWSVTVNGNDANIQVVNNGMMAVKVLPGNNDIQFNYKTPGLAAGGVISGISLLLLILMML